MKRKHPVSPETVKPGQESVWHCPRPPALAACTDRVRLVLSGHTIADTIRAIRVLEASHPQILYVPPADVYMGG